MIFVDTNYIFRYLLRDVNEQNLLVEKIFIEAFENNVRVISSTVVFFEIQFVLKKYYKKNKQEVIAFLMQILTLTFIGFEDRQILKESIVLFEKTNLDLEDCYNIYYAKSRGVTSGSFKTFDKKLEKEFNK
jgi:predicted nucleic-acid-binding protein